MSMLLDPDIANAGIQVCTRCMYDERVSSISFDDEGVCNYCHQVDMLKQQFGTGSEKGQLLLQSLIREMREAGRNKPYDCVVGVSGGTDSSYLVHLAKEWGLRPLAVHYDNTWNSAIATMNIQKVLSILDVDLYTHVVNNKEVDDILRSFFLAGVAELDAHTDLGYAFLLRQVTAKYGIHHILEGHSFVAEGITPLGRNYFDGRYIQAIHQQFGTIPMETYPLMTFWRFLKSAALNRVKFIRPFWYMDYSKEEAKEFLSRRYQWIYYGGHHLENRITSFAHSVYLPQKFGADMRNNTLSARVRNGTMTRADAWAEYNLPPNVEHELVNYFKKRLDLGDEIYEEVMSAPPKNWTQYPTYKKRFERLRPLFYMLAKANLVPMSFYLKYCFPAKAPA
jgi:N-acetyl sugar amidotransferase